MMKNAGLSKGHLNLAYFEDTDELRTILGKIGISEGEGGRLARKDGDEIRCESCSTSVTVDNVGHILPGSTHIYCRDPTCILDYYERFFER